MFSWLFTDSGETEIKGGRKAHACFEQEKNLSLTAIQQQLPTECPIDL